MVARSALGSDSLRAAAGYFILVTRGVSYVSDAVHTSDKSYAAGTGLVRRTGMPRHGSEIEQDGCVILVYWVAGWN